MVDYEFYSSVYHGGAIPDDDWAELEARAADQLRRYKRIYTVTAPDEQAEGMAVCAMAEALHNVDLIVSGDAGAVQSASIGSVSTSYGSAAATTVDVSEKGQAKALYRAACLYLDICRGVGWMRALRRRKCPDRLQPLQSDGDRLPLGRRGHLYPDSYSRAFLVSRRLRTWIRPAAER